MELTENDQKQARSRVKRARDTSSQNSCGPTYPVCFWAMA
jgi:hypothetical protein